MKIISTLLIAIFLVSCGSDEVTESEGNITFRGEETQQQFVSPVLLSVSLNTVNMRVEPHMNSEVVAKLPHGSKLIWQNKVSKTTSPVRLRGVKYNDPWLYVKNGQEQNGWIYGATVEVQTNTDAGKKLHLRLMSGRINSFFDEGAISSLITYQNDYINAQTSAEMLKVTSSGEAISASLNKVLTKKIKVDPKAKPDVKWLDSVMPGYKHVYLEKKKTFSLVPDYMEMIVKAKQTTGEEDEDAFQKAFGSAGK